MLVHAGPACPEVVAAVDRSGLGADEQRALAAPADDARGAALRRWIGQHDDGPERLPREVKKRVEAAAVVVGRAQHPPGAHVDRAATPGGEGAAAGRDAAGPGPRPAMAAGPSLVDPASVGADRRCAVRRELGGQHAPVNQARVGARERGAAVDALVQTPIGAHQQASGVTRVESDGQRLDLASGVQRGEAGALVAAEPGALVPGPDRNDRRVVRGDRQRVQRVPVRVRGARVGGAAIGADEQAFVGGGDVDRSRIARGEGDAVDVA